MRKGDQSTPLIYGFIYSYIRQYVSNLIRFLVSMSNPDTPIYAVQQRLALLEKEEVGSIFLGLLPQHIHHNL